LPSAPAAAILCGVLTLLQTKLRLESRLLRSAIVRRPLTADCRRETGYLLVGLITGTAGFTFVIAGGSTAFGLAITIVGLPLAVLVARADRRWCAMERSRAAAVLKRPVPPRYRSVSGRRGLSRWLSVLGDRQTWLDAAWMFSSFPLGVIGFTIAVAVWTGVLGLLTAPIWLWSVGWPSQFIVLGSILEPFLAVPAAVLAAWLIRGTALAQAGLAASMLGASRTDVLSQRVQTLAETRAGAVDVAVEELQRVERDLHDGAQARLVALAMDLGLAEQRLAHADPATALEHVSSARGQARAAMAELRDLVRGIGPSILNDRGLDAALTALVSGRTPPVELRVELPGTEVGTRETAAYFVVAEALANARKHAQATQITVRAYENEDRTLIVEVTDDGAGGADAQSGSGLSGLRKRVAALDGTLTIVSPPGGPTTVRAVLPCAS
jgi:signal transduction histidine kinase